MYPKYLTVRNWAKFQGRIGKSTRRPYIKTATNLDSDSDFAQLTMIQRYVLEGCRRLIGLHGQNLSSDPMLIVRAMCVRPEERHSATRAVGKLVESGLLILTDDKDPFGEVHNVTKLNVKNTQTDPSTQQDPVGAFQIEED